MGKTTGASDKTPASTNVIKNLTEKECHSRTYRRITKKNNQDKRQLLGIDEKERQERFDTYWETLEKFKHYIKEKTKSTLDL